ncbi:MAG TPA: Gfo/Idh/MocA family oxidoreductase [Candidatus Limnocylindrales bacterium]|nr:Gfo/Idh/MocA family oxidoreductase [Candidatus Limnocylindrales bacterium]
MAQKVKWGILGAASIARRRVIPAMQDSTHAEVSAIASRSFDTAKAVAAGFSIPKVYGSYEELLADPEIAAIYNPLPNHLHVEWSIRAASRGKHVLCEKPLSRNVPEARRLLEARDEYHVKIGEAFMVRTHPQWLRTEELIRGGRIGKLRSAFGYFSYFNVDPANVNNIADFAGGGLMDIGCYPIKTSRFIFGEEPVRVIGCVERDPSFKTDRLTSAILEFPTGQGVFTVSTQIAYYQKMQFLGTAGRIDVEVPFNPPTDKPVRIFIDDGKNLYAGGSQIVESFPLCNQFNIQADLFSKAILENGEVPNPLEDSICNMAVIDALFRSADSGKWETPERL